MYLAFNNPEIWFGNLSVKWFDEGGWLLPRV